MLNQRVKRLLGRYDQSTSAKSWDFYTTNRTLTQYRLARQIRLVLELIKSNINPDSEPKILDVGCGTGRFLINLMEIGQVYGADISEEMLKVAKINTHGKTTLVQSDAENLPFPANDFDVVTCSNLLENLNGPEDSPIKVIQEMFRVSKKDGIVLVCVESWYSVLSVYNYILAFVYNKRPLNWYGKNKINEIIQTVQPTSYKIHNLSPITVFTPWIPRCFIPYINHLDAILEKKLPNLGAELILELRK